MLTLMDTCLAYICEKIRCYTFSSNIPTDIYLGIQKFNALRWIKFYIPVFSQVGYYEIYDNNKFIIRIFGGHHGYKISDGLIYQVLNTYNILYRNNIIYKIEWIGGTDIYFDFYGQPEFKVKTQIDNPDQIEITKYCISGPPNRIYKICLNPGSNPLFELLRNLTPDSNTIIIYDVKFYILYYTDTRYNGKKYYYNGSNKMEFTYYPDINKIRKVRNMKTGDIIYYSKNGDSVRTLKNIVNDRYIEQNWFINSNNKKIEYQAVITCINEDEFLFHGYYAEIYRNKKGKIHIMRDGYYNFGRRTGEWSEYDKNGVTISRKVYN